MIEVEGLKKRFGTTRAVDDLSFRVKDGEIYGLIGPNGSGKTTTMEILSGIARPSSGRAIVEGVDANYDPIQVKKTVGYIPESPVLYQSLTPVEMLSMVAGIRNIPERMMRKRVDYFVDAFNLEEYMDKYIGSLSFGTKQKVSLVSGLAHDPKVIILDEAMNGLDPKVAKILREILFEFKKKGKSIVFSTHVLPLAEMVCDRIGVLSKGEMIAEGTMEELKKKSHKKSLEDVFLKLTEGEEEVNSVIRALEDSL